MSDILARIVAQTRLDVDQRKSHVSADKLRHTASIAARSTHTFLNALQVTPPSPGVHLLAEFKPKSPSRGEIRKGATVADIVPVYAAHASAISILCDVPFFGGGYSVLAAARALTNKPLLCKDFIVDEYQLLEARSSGADAVLLMASVLDDDALRSLHLAAKALGLDALIEVHDADELARVLEVGPEIIGVNSRNLRTMAIDHAEMFRLLGEIPPNTVRVAESGFGDTDGIKAARGRAEVILMGTELMLAPDIASRIVELGF